METVIRRVLVMLFSGLLTFFGVMNASASNSTKSKTLVTVSNQEIQIVQKTEAQTEEIFALEVKKPNAKIIVKDDKTSPKKVNVENATNKTIKKKEVSRSSFNARLQSEGCFTSCLERNANPDTVLACAGACAGGDYKGVLELPYM